MLKDTVYYNKEVSMYSQKRYPETSTDYVHFFFKKRRAILMRILRDVVRMHPEASALLEVGCADGVILRNINEQFPQFKKLVGVDLSPGMVAEAIEQSPKDIEFHVRTNETQPYFDVVVEVGVLNLADLEGEFTFAKRSLKSGGYYICSLASRTSLRSRLKNTSIHFAHNFSFSEYEQILREHFSILEEEAYALFVPFLWKVPFLGRLLQPIFEVVGKIAWTDLFHEKIYLLKRK